MTDAASAPILSLQPRLFPMPPEPVADMTERDARIVLDHLRACPDGMSRLHLSQKTVREAWDSWINAGDMAYMVGLLPLSLRTQALVGAAIMTESAKYIPPVRRQEGIVDHYHKAADLLSSFADAIILAMPCDWFSLAEPLRRAQPQADVLITPYRGPAYLLEAFGWDAVPIDEKPWDKQPREKQLAMALYQAASFTLSTSGEVRPEPHWTMSRLEQGIRQGLPSAIRSACSADLILRAAWEVRRAIIAQEQRNA
jgi:hypothetical protein